MELVHRLRAWSYGRQLLGKSAATPVDALRAVVAVYATHPTSPLALAARTRTLSAAAYRRIDKQRLGIRIPAMRKTVFLVPRHNAAKIFTAARPSPAEVERALRRHGMSRAEYEVIASKVLAAAQQPARSQELQEATELKGQVMGTILRCLRYDGRVVALAGDSLMSSPHLYVTASRWAPEGLDTGDKEAALEWLAGQYLHAYGPARVADFAWWAGASKSAARKAVEAHETLEVGDGLLLPRVDEAGFAEVARLRGTVDLLPKWDAYTMGHAPDGRARFVHPDLQERVYTPIGVGLPGDGNPVILVDGEAVGIWNFTLKEGPWVEPFDGFGPRMQRAIGERMEAVVAFLRG